MKEQLFDIAERERVPKVPAHGVAHRISAGSVCRHLKIAGRIAFFTISSGYQSPLAEVATQPVRSRVFHHPALKRSPEFLAKVATEAWSTFVPEDSSGKVLQVWFPKAWGHALVSWRPTLRPTECSLAVPC